MSGTGRSSPRAPPRTKSGPQPFAGWWLRVAAYLVDTVLLLTGSALVLLVIWTATGKPGTAAVALAITWAATEYLLRGLVYAPLLMRRAGGRNGQTLGKQAAGVRVVRADGRPISYGSAVTRDWLVRTLVFQVGGALTGGVATLVDYLSPLWDERKQALHDRVAKTLVVRVS